MGNEREENGDVVDRRGEIEEASGWKGGAILLPERREEEREMRKEKTFLVFKKKLSPEETFTGRGQERGIGREREREGK